MLRGWQGEAMEFYWPISINRCAGEETLYAVLRHQRGVRGFTTKKVIKTSARKIP